jgi:SAM-dependent methyltransferase
MRDNTQLQHFLWEADQHMETSPDPYEERHWSAPSRQEHFKCLDPADTFDLVIACDCLYWHSQIEPLAAVLRRRIRKPCGRAVVSFQNRGTNKFFLGELAARLRESGMCVEEETADWPWEAILQAHIRCVEGQEEYQLKRLDHDIGHVLLLHVSWASAEHTREPIPVVPLPASCVLLEAALLGAPVTLLPLLLPAAAIELAPYA